MPIKSLIARMLGRKITTCSASELLTGVRQAYSAAADAPERRHPFPMGKEFAVGVGYSQQVLDSLPAAAVSSFVGVGPVGEFAEIAPGAVVLDLGCGAGLDAQLAARKSGSQGRVVGLDFSLSMLQKAKAASRQAALSTTLFACADAGSLPLATASMDVVLVNGLFNLNPVRDRLFQEMARVLKPGGSLFAAELVFIKPQPDRQARDINEWLA